MSQNLDSLHLPIPQGKGKSVFSGKAAALAGGLAAIVLLFVAVTLIVPGTSSLVETTDVASLPATNPELMVAERYFRETAKRSEAAFLSANPELMVARYHAEAAARKAEDTFLAANPELMAVQRHDAPEAPTLGSGLNAVPAPQPLALKAVYSDSDESATLAANPELMIFHRFVSTNAVE